MSSTTKRLALASVVLCAPLVMAKSATCGLGTKVAIVVDGPGGVLTDDTVVTEPCTGEQLEGPGCLIGAAGLTTLTLTATPNDDAVFTTWGGDCADAGNEPTCTIELENETHYDVTAAFGIADAGE